ncbi:MULTISPECIES: lytic transglycosylase domain-containing protein [Pseudothermotoga]|jgi:hypothetical protein|uniref:lytic transglycosylase domain-containing protein n=3 Tax=Thermotogaceae TaxID=188709 RepID=UPI0007496F41|nr:MULTISPECIES: lytic transglycosylase domain-containing protein [Pseudothermotoga]KUK20399.1 MAG: Lytic transglycosylase catalytic [Pseudothermotoga lettingae]MDK2883602.1 hypothetical protein [Pseudothermotoga sp.]HBT25558.1 hypothetical protein [Pseudothermotoga sp.]
MRKILLIINIAINCLLFADPLFLLTDPKTHFSIELYTNKLQLSIFQPFFYSSVPIDLLIDQEDDSSILKGLISVESAFFIHAVSEKGAMGLTQMMPSTAYELGVLNAFNPFQALNGAKLYLNKLQERFGKIDYALSAYYEGPSKVSLYGPSEEGRKYSQKVIEESKKFEGNQVFIRDVFYLQPYISVGKELNDLSAGLSFVNSFLGIVDFQGGFDISAGEFSHYFFAYPRISHSLSLIFGEKNLEFVAGISYTKLPNFGVKLLLNSNYFDISIKFKLWQVIFSAGWSSEGLHLGVIK